MVDTKFTPGPWVVGYLKGDVGVADDGKTGGYAKLFDVRGWGYLTGKGHGGLGLSEGEARVIQDANAHLIAAAPELYEACREALIMLKHLNVTGSLIDQVNSALAKARGEQP